MKKWLASLLTFAIVFTVGWLSVHITVSAQVIPPVEIVEDSFSTQVIKFDNIDDAEDIANFMTDEEFCDEVIVDDVNNKLEFVRVRDGEEDKLLGTIPLGGFIQITTYNDKQWVTVIKPDGYHEYWER